MTRLTVLGPALLALAARLLTGPHPIDDAYITFRYARNLAEGAGLVYNTGEWVLGTTTPLWALILAAGARLGLTDLPWLATLLSAVCDAGAAALLVLLARRMGWSAPAAALVGLAWALNPMSIAFASGGMETSLFVVAVLGCLTLAASGRHLPVAAALAGLATFIRPEGALLAAVIVVWTFFTRRRQTVTVTGSAAAPLLLGGLILFMRYGSPLPHSVAAKQVAYQRAWPFENTVALLVQAGLPGWSSYLLGTLPTVTAVLLAALGLGVLVALVRRGIPRLNRAGLSWQPFAAFAVLYLVFYAAMGLRGVRLFPWYLVPIEPFYLLGAAAGLLHLARWRASAWLPALLVLWQLPAIDWRQPLLPVGADFAREHLLLDVGRELGATLPPGAVIAAPEIGALGYASRLRVLDTVGLISPSAVPYYPLPPEQLVTDNAIPARLILDQQPDVVVTLDAFAQRSLLPDPGFQRQYHLERSYPVAVWQSQQLLMFRRLDLIADR
jgi:arabinofuranosyltransferase